MSKSGLGQQVTLRVSDGDVDRIDSLTDELPLKRSAVIRAALRLGLELLEEDPTQLLRRKGKAAAAEPQAAPQVPSSPLRSPATTWSTY